MKLYLKIIIILLAWLTIGCQAKKEEGIMSNEDSLKEDFPNINLKYGLPIDEFTVITDTIRNNETLSEILSRYHISASTIHTVAEKAEGIFSVRRFRPNHQYSLLYCNTDSLASPDYFIYEKNLAEYIVFDLTDTIQVTAEFAPRETREEIYENTINSSLWNSLTENNKSPALALKLADVYQWAIDFYAIQEGDSYKVLYKEDYVEDKPLGNILPIAGKFVHQGRPYYAFWFEAGEVRGFFDEKGESLHKAFLKAPLKFTRISSRFSNSRLHPVLKYRRAHKGVDYAAPTGTPVRTVGDGVVIKKAYQRGGAGNYVKIKHNKTFTTVYMHFVRHVKGLKVGQRVRQGDIIGYVGMTGSATGPHLHYGVQKNGQYINPLSMESPPLKPLKGDVLNAFMVKRDSLLNVLGEKLD